MTLWRHPNQYVVTYRVQGDAEERIEKVFEFNKEEVLRDLAKMNFAPVECVQVITIKEVIY